MRIISALVMLLAIVSSSDKLLNIFGRRSLSSGKCLVDNPSNAGRPLCYIDGKQVDTCSNTGCGGCCGSQCSWVGTYCNEADGVVAKCPGGYSQVGTLSKNNDIGGAGLGQSQQNSIADCKNLCDKDPMCVAFMYGGANTKEASTLCELSGTVTPNNDWGTNFRFCRKTECLQSFVLGMNVYAHMSGLYTETSTKFNNRPVYEHESGNHWILARETSSLDLQWVLNFGGIDNEWTVSDYASSRNEDYPWLASWPDGETFTLGTNCDGSNDAARRQMEEKEISTLQNRLINLQN